MVPGVGGGNGGTVGLLLLGVLFVVAQVLFCLSFAVYCSEGERQVWFFVFVHVEDLDCVGDALCGFVVAGWVYAMLSVLAPRFVTSFYRGLVGGFFLDVSVLRFRDFRFDAFACYISVPRDFNMVF